MRTDQVVDKIITILKAHLPGEIDKLDTSLEDIRAGLGREDCYYFGDVTELPSVFPAISIRIRSEDFSNQDQGYPKIDLGIEMEFVMTGDYEQTINRSIIKYKEAIEEIIYTHRTLDNTVANCEIVSALFSNIWKGREGGNLFKAFLMELKVSKI